MKHVFGNPQVTVSITVVQMYTKIFPTVFVSLSDESCIGATWHGTVNLIQKYLEVKIYSDTKLQLNS